MALACSDAGQVVTPQFGKYKILSGFVGTKGDLGGLKRAGFWETKSQRALSNNCSLQQRTPGSESKDLVLTRCRWEIDHSMYTIEGRFSIEIEYV